MKRRIIVTGISSFLITKLVKLIDTTYYEVVGISRNSNFRISNDIEIVEGNLHNIQKLSKLFQNCDMIIHGAALTHSRNEKAYFDLNLKATNDLLRFSNINKACHFVFISSYVAGNESGAYGKSKFLAEKAVKQVANRWTILRLSEVFGGNKYEGIEKLIHDTMTKSVIFCPTGLKTKLYPIHAEDAAHCMFNYIFNCHVNETKVINGSEGFTYKEVIELIDRVSNRRTKMIYLSKGLMFLIKRFIKVIPINIGVVPDQIDRLYSIKHIEPNKNNIIDLETYIRNELKDRLN